MDVPRTYKVKWSNFHVTINFNKPDSSLLSVMAEAVEMMVTPEYLWKWLKRYDGEKQVDFDTFTAKYEVKRVRIRASFEHGGTRNKGLHVHLLIEIEHTTMVQISKDGIVQVMKDLVGHTPNVHCRFVPGQGEDKNFLLHYITKEVPTEPARNPANRPLQRGEVFAEVETDL